MANILFILTNTPKYPTRDRATGLWLGEATHAAEVLEQAGHHIDYASPLGGYVPIDPHSLKYANVTDWHYLENADFRQRALGQSLKADTCHAVDYQAIYFAGGHGVMWDFPDQPALVKLATDIYQNGGFVSAVCMVLLLYQR